MSFEFRKTDVYQRALQFHKDMKSLIKELDIDRRVADQLYRASLSVALNVAEGYGRFHKADKRNFYVMSRASVH